MLRRKETAFKPKTVQMLVSLQDEALCDFKMQTTLLRNDSKEIKWKTPKQCLFITKCISEIKDNRNLMAVASMPEWFFWSSLESQANSSLISSLCAMKAKTKCDALTVEALVQHHTQFRDRTAQNVSENLPRV